jgi:hypothetical protein
VKVEGIHMITCSGHQSITGFLISLYNNSDINQRRRDLLKIEEYVN